MLIPGSGYEDGANVLAAMEMNVDRGFWIDCTVDTLGTATVFTGEIDPVLGYVESIE